MLSRPTTEQILLDCRNELLNTIDPVAKGPHSTPDVVSALATFDAGASDSLHLDDVAATYDLAGGCLSVALEVVMAAGDDALHLKGRALLDTRLAHETEIMGEWSFVGRA
jgi:hypothetical protein